MMVFIEESRGALGVEPICNVLQFAPFTLRPQRRRGRDSTRNGCLDHVQHAKCVQKKAVAMIGHCQKPGQMHGRTRKASHWQAMTHGLIPRKGGIGGAGHVKHW